MYVSVLCLESTYSYLLAVVRRRMPCVFSVAICDLQGCERTTREGVAKPVVRFRTCVVLIPLRPPIAWWYLRCGARLYALCVCVCAGESLTLNNASPISARLRPRPPPVLAPCLRPVLALRSFSERYCRNDYYAEGKAGAPILFYTGNESPVQEYGEIKGEGGGGGDRRKS